MKRFGTLIPCLLLTGCILSNPPARNSKFVADITDFKKSDVLPDTWIYQHPETRVADYDKFIVSPLRVYPNPATKIKKNNRPDYDALADTLRNKVISMMEKHYRLADQPGPNVLVLDFSIIDIKPVVEVTRPDGTEAVVMDTMLKGSKLELDCRDSMNDEHIFAMSSLFKGDDFKAYENKGLLPNVEKAFDNWIVVLSSLFQKAKAAPSPTGSTP